MWKIGWSDAGELSPNVIDVKIAVRTIVVAQAEIGAHGLSIRGIHLNEARKRQKAVERVVALQARKCN